MEVKLTKFKYNPGGKCDCGWLGFTAETRLGTFEWEEVIPSLQYGEDAASRILKLNGKQVDDQHLYLPDFEPPQKDGRFAEEFRRTGEALVAESFGTWLESCANFDFVAATA